MKKTQIIRDISLVSLGALMVAMLGCGGGGKGDTLAVVDGERISMEQFYTYLEVKPEVQIQLANGQIGTAKVTDTLAFQAMQDLIRQRVILQLAKDEKVYPTADEVNKELEFQRKRDSTFVRALMERGLSVIQIKESLTVDPAREKLLTADIKVTDQDVEKYIKENPAEFTQPERVSALWIFVKQEATRRQVDRALNAGTSFTNVAVRYSEDPAAKSTNGRFPREVLAQLPPEISSVLRTTKEGGDSTWVRLSDGWAKFYVEKYNKAEKVEINDTDREWLRRQLAVRRGLEAKDLDKRLVSKLKAAKISIDFKDLQKPWTMVMDQLKETDKLDSGSATSKATPESASNTETK